MGQILHGSAKTTEAIRPLPGRGLRSNRELWLKVDGAVKTRFILGAGPSIFGHDYIARQKDR